MGTSEVSIYSKVGTSEVSRYRWTHARGKQTLVLLSPAPSCGKIFLHLDQHLSLVGLIQLVSEVTQEEPVQGS